MSTDLEIITPINDNSGFYVHFESGGGEDVNVNIPTITGINNDAFDNETFPLTELWFESHISEKVRFRLGKVDLTTDFDMNAVANSETYQFLSPGFVNNSAVEFPDNNGFGAILWLSPLGKMNIGLGIGDSRARWKNISDNLFAILELDFIIKPLEKPGNYRFYGWLNQKQHEKIPDPNDKRINSQSFGVSFDQEIAKYITLFGRYGRRLEEIYETSDIWSAGFKAHCGAIGRDDDVFGFAYGLAAIGDDWEKNDRLNGIISGDESHIEAYYALKLNDNLTISPDFQWVRNPSGIETHNDIYVFGIRSQLSF